MPTDTIITDETCLEVVWIDSTLAKPYTALYSVNKGSH